MGRMRQFHCPGCSYVSPMLADGPGTMSARALYRCTGCREVVSVTTRLFGEDTTAEERAMEHALAGCAVVELLALGDDPPSCPRCSGTLDVSRVGLWD